MSVSGTGEFSGKTSGFGNSVTDYFFFSGEETSTNNFADNDFAFGFQASSIHIENEDAANDIAYQWVNQSGNEEAGGIVRAGSERVIRNPGKRGVRIKSLVDGSHAKFSVSAV